MQKIDFVRLRCRYNLNAVKPLSDKCQTFAIQELMDVALPLAPPALIPLIHVSTGVKDGEARSLLLVG